MPRARKRSRPKRTRTRLRWRPVLWLLLIVNLGAGAAISKVTRVRTARVEGAAPYDRVRLAEIMAKMQDTPVLRLNVRQLEWEAVRAPSVREATISVNPFGSALLRVRYRTPVMRLYGERGVVLDENGVLYRLPDDAIPEGLPILKLDRKVPPTLLTLAADWPVARISKLAPKVRTLWPSGGVRIDVDDRGAVCLNKGAGRVVLGSTDDLERKLAVLRQRMTDDPDELARVLELNLTQPDRPSVVQRPPDPSSPERKDP